MPETSNFIHDIVEADLDCGKYKNEEIHTRFPPEPNGYLHIGHCKALIIDFGTAEKYGGKCNLRMDDTNPAKEDEEFVDAIKEDIHWLGFDWDDRFYYGSDYFPQTYEFAVELIKKGLAYVCQLSPEEFKANRGDIGVPAVSPYRDRSIDESLDLFERMKNGEFAEGSMTLRAKIDLESGNFNMRDPVLYRIRYIEHHRQGTKWCIFPMYDFAHPIQDALEGITHSLCSLEYEEHRPLYDWVVNNVSVPSIPRQIEFARLNINYTVMSKRKLRKLVEDGYVSGWDDPRMPTLCGLRRRGYTPSSIRNFIERIGVAKNASIVEYSFLEHCIREELNETALRRIAVLEPIKVIVDNYPADKTEYFSVPNNPNNPDAGMRELPFTRELYIDAADFAEVPPPKYFRLKPEGEVRLMGAYIIKCGEIIHTDDGKIKEIHVTADLETRNNTPSDGRKIKGTIHWLSAVHNAEVDLILYDKLFTEADVPDDFISCINPDSSVTLHHVKVEPSVADSKPGDKYQFVRTGYFCMDSKIPGTFNRIVELKDSFTVK